MTPVSLWLPNVLYAIIGIIGITGNSLVVYFAHKSRDTGVFRHLNKAVRNLAITDCLYGICSVPATITMSIWSKCRFALTGVAQCVISNTLCLKYY